MTFQKISTSFDPIKAFNANINIETKIENGKVKQNIFHNTIVLINGTYEDIENLDEQTGDISDLNPLFDGSTELIYEEAITEMYELINNKKDLNFEFNGRNEFTRAITEEWLATHDQFYDLLLMRKDQDYRQDAVIKEEIYNLHIQPNFSVTFCVDDRKQVVDMWRRMGLICLQCDEGEF